MQARCRAASQRRSRLMPRAPAASPISTSASRLIGNQAHRRHEKQALPPARDAAARSRWLPRSARSGGQRANAGSGNAWSGCQPHSSMNSTIAAERQQDARSTRQIHLNKIHLRIRCTTSAQGLPRGADPGLSGGRSCAYKGVPGRAAAAAIGHWRSRSLGASVRDRKKGHANSSIRAAFSDRGGVSVEAGRQGRVPSDEFASARRWNAHSRAARPSATGAAGAEAARNNLETPAARGPPATCWPGPGPGRRDFSRAIAASAEIPARKDCRPGLPEHLFGLSRRRSRAAGCVAALL